MVLFDGPEVDEAAASRSLRTCGFLPLFLPTGAEEVSKDVAPMLPLPLPEVAVSPVLAATAPHDESHSCEPAGCMAICTAEWGKKRQCSRGCWGTAN